VRDVDTDAMTTAVASPLLASAAEIAELHGLQDVAIGKDVAALFSVHGSEPDFAKTAHALLPEIIDDHAQASSLITAQWYDDLDPGSKFRATPFAEIPREQIAKSIDWALYAPGDQPPVERMTGDSKRIVRNASRQTVVRNAAAEGVRWARYAKPTACSYCRALAIRGSGKESRKYLYYSDKSAIFRKSDGEKYHTNCDCEPIAVRGGSVWTPPDYMDEWDKQYNDAAGKTPKGPKYFQRIAAQMRADEPPTPEQVAKAAQDEADKAEADAAAKIANGRALLFTELKAAQDSREVAAAAAQLLPDTDVDFPALDDLDEYGVENMRQVVHAVDDVLTAYPQLHVEAVSIKPLDDGTYAQEEYWPKRQYRMVSLNQQHVELPGLMVNKWNGNVADGYHHAGKVESPTYNVIVHEMAHAMEDNARENGVKVDEFMVMTALADYFKATRPAVSEMSTHEQEMEFRAWVLGGVSRYSLKDPGRVVDKLLEAQGIVPQTISLNLSEALAEGFADVFINGDDAQEPSKVMTKVLTDALAGVSYWEARNGSVASAV
jgi:hypothetical protein